MKRIKIRASSIELTVEEMIDGHRSFTFQHSTANRRYFSRKRLNFQFAKVVIGLDQTEFGYEMNDGRMSEQRFEDFNGVFGPFWSDDRFQTHYLEVEYLLDGNAAA